MIPNDLSIPECLRREITPENVAARARLVELDRNQTAGGRKLRQRRLSDEQATELRVQDEARRRWHSWIPTMESRHRPRLATFERLVREEFKTKVERRDSVMAEASMETAPAVATEESVVGKTKAKTSKARSAVKGKTSAKAPERAPTTPGGVRPGSKVALVADLLLREEGCTTADVLKATGWPSVSMPQQAKAAGLNLQKEKDGGVTRYRGVAA
jgi:hypothetical protein